jgi:predicted ribosomally synthesized peptide with nif11-like leader
MLQPLVSKLQRRSSLEKNMSHQAVRAFIDKVNQDAALGAMVSKAFAEQSDLDLVELAGQHGFAFSREEGLKVWEEVQASGELPDALLESMSVAGGAPQVCANTSM